ncbi:MAG: arginine deiminase-related protein [Xanthomonadaceae bacterium]|nr:arginine deiminase-related protein [Xanthomonadaceae bacterium]MDP2185295.1 arginine deiminase-related protein [Xanthomonadales bacterium]MDZ4115834.1 arginine deiminase-related protein [Xanthomonadaceae bacterium]MDZ4378663.1 arginine deiminase-related protein [Xanthomonadaceae bacterium]
MITRDVAAFVAFARRVPADLPVLPRGVFMVSPEGFALAEQSASDNGYMQQGGAVDAERALAQHRGLQRRIAQSLPAICFPGNRETPDAVFANNVFATVAGRLLIAPMRHPVRQREAERSDIPDFFKRAMGYEIVDLRSGQGVAELTGSLIVDRARGLGFCGLSARCDEAGAAAMHAAFGLRATLLFDLASGEYHTNVLMNILAGRALVICPDGFADPDIALALQGLYPHTMVLDTDVRLGFAGNCIALSTDSVWMSTRAAAGLSESNRIAFAAAQFTVIALPLDELEKAGGSLRCCVAEIF